MTPKTLRPLLMQLGLSVEIKDENLELCGLFISYYGNHPKLREYELVNSPLSDMNNVESRNRSSVSHVQFRHLRCIL